MEHERYAVLTAGTGQQALDVATRLHPDLVVLDLMLPDLPGEEVARSLRAITDVPIIMLTAKAGEADRVAREVRVDGNPVALTRLEFDLLDALPGLLAGTGRNGAP